MAFQLKGKLSLDGAGYQAGLKRAKSATKGFAAGTKKMMAGAAGAMAGMFAFGAIKSAITGTIEWGTKVRDLATKFGLTTKTVQELEYAFTQTGISVEDGMKAFKTMQVFQHRTLSAFRGSMRRNELAASFKMLGASIDDVKNLSPQELFYKIGESLKNADTSSQGLTEALGTVFGGSGKDLLVTFGSDLKGMTNHFREMGTVVEDSLIQRLGSAGDKMEELKLRTKSLLAEMSASGMEGFDWFAGGVQNLGSYLGYRLGGMDVDEASRQTWIIDANQRKLKSQKDATDRKRAKGKEGQRQNQLVANQMANEEKTKKMAAANAARENREKAATEREQKRLATWNRHGPDSLEKIGGRQGAISAQLNISQKQLALAIAAQTHRKESVRRLQLISLGLNPDAGNL